MKLYGVGLSLSRKLEEALASFFCAPGTVGAHWTVSEFRWMNHWWDCIFYLKWLGEFKLISRSSLERQAGVTVADWPWIWILPYPASWCTCYVTPDKKLPSLSLRFLNLWTDDNDCLTLVARFIEFSSRFFWKEHWLPTPTSAFPFQRKRSQLQYLILNTRKAWQRTRRSLAAMCLVTKGEKLLWRRTLLWRTSLPSRWLLSESDPCSWQVPFRSEGGHRRLGRFSSSFGSQGWGQEVWMEGWI